MNFRDHICFCLPVILLVLTQQTGSAQNSPAPEMLNAAEPKVTIPAGTASIPMLDFGGRPGVNVRINGQGPFAFVVDTGASHTVLDSSLADELSLPAAAGGSTIKQIEMEGVTVHDLPVMAGPLLRMPGKENPRGVLSALAFPGYLFTFDFPHREITIRFGALGEPNSKTIFSYESGDPPSVPVKVAGREYQVHLDTGAPFPLALPTKYKDEVPLEGALEEGHKARTPSGEFPIYKGSLKGEIEIGGEKLSVHEIFFSDAVPHPGATPRGQIGCAALRDFAVTLDARNNRLEFTKSE
jgi:Aspartyl protease